MATLSAGIDTKSTLQLLQLGKSVAEFDDSLEKYFIENQAYLSLINDRADFIAGDKGTGKTAVYKILQKRYSTTPELKNTEVIAGFNPVGNPVFQRLVRQDVNVLTEGQYVSVWKAYVLSLVGNWLIDIVGDDYSSNLTRLHKLLDETKLLSKGNKPETIFGKIVTLIKGSFIPDTSETTLTISETGLPIVSQKFTFGEKAKHANERAIEITHEEAFELLNDCLSEVGLSVWVALDRLDEAFQGYPAIEVPALRALLRTYLDLLAFDKVRLKIFVRKDLFRKIIGDGFVNLTHINERKVEIIWDDADLLNLLSRRIRDSSEFIHIMEAQTDSDESLFYKIFPEKVDAADRKPITFNWIISRIRDGNDVRAPRNLIDLVGKATEEQIRADSRTPRVINTSGRLVMSDALRRALSRLSDQRVQDTLLAEVGPEISGYINKFNSKKSEHNLETLSQVLELDGEKLQYAIKQLVETGFLEEFKGTWKIPMLYREGLGITQGKAFA
ncbi:hypothetical protein ACMS0D_000630 [Cronobacter turicensis]